MCSDCRETGERRKDFRHTKAGPEEITGRAKKKSKRWCKGKEGREHRYEQVIWYSYKYKDHDGNDRVRNTYRWICQGCGKVSWGRPAPPVGKHEHCFCITKVSERWRREEIYEQCCICAGKGRSYSFYKPR